MRKVGFVAFCLLVLGSAVAQDKLSSKWNCPKPATNPTLEVGDVPGHSYALGQGTCSATASDLGEKSGAYTEFHEGWKASYTGHGRFNVTLDNGDTVYYTYESKGPSDIKKPANNTFKVVGGTGKHKGIKGSGTCEGTRHEDGSSDWTCTGTTSMAK